MEVKYLRQAKQTVKTEQIWREVRESISMLEDWVKEIAEEEGSIEFEHINKTIKVDRDIAKKIEEKTRA